jgi:hypothetical protein
LHDSASLDEVFRRQPELFEAELTQCAQELVGIAALRADPKIDITRKTRVPVIRNGVAADDEELNSVRVQ